MADIAVFDCCVVVVDRSFRLLNQDYHKIFYLLHPWYAQDLCGLSFVNSLLTRELHCSTFWVICLDFPFISPFLQVIHMTLEFDANQLLPLVVMIMVSFANCVTFTRLSKDAGRRTRTVLEKVLLFGEHQPSIS